MRTAVLFTVLGVLTACSGDDTSSVEPPTAAPAESAAETDGPTSGVSTVTIAGSAFEPASVTLPEGDALTVRNEDTATHTFTMDDGSIDETLEPGDQVEVTPEAAGGFHCEIHPSMTGSLSFG